MIEGVGATIVVEFGDGVPRDHRQVQVELDETLNLLPDGEVRTQWAPGDEAWFWVHFDPAQLRLDRVAATSGQVVAQGGARRSRSQELTFTRADEPVALNYLPAASAAMRWYGTVGQGLRREGREVRVSGPVPCTGDAEIPIDVRLYRYLPPPLELAEDETYRVVIVIYMEAV